MRVSSSDPEKELEPGALVSGRYRIESVLGRGATSVVYEAALVQPEDGDGQRRVAIKVLRAALADGTIAAKRFEREAQLVARLDHPAIVRLHATGWLETRQPWLALEMLRGETLEARLAREGPMPLARLAPLLSDVLDALATAHAARILHRDLKPANLLIVPHPELGEHAKLLDFGVSRDLGDLGARLTAPPQLVGTLAYLAPEQLKNEVDPDERADLWAVGVVAYLALTGCPPFGTRSTRVIWSILETTPALPSTLVARLDPAVDAFVMRALAKPRDARYRSAAAMREALLSLV